MKHPRSVIACALALAALLSSLLVGCDEPTPPADTNADAAPPPDARCPAEWVAAARGGCGPAVVLCATGGGAAPGACDRVDLSRAHPVGDGGVGESFRLDPAGELAGAWRLPGEEGGPPAPTWSPDAGTGAPAATWRPDAGVPTCPPGWTRSADGLCDAALRACAEGSEPLPGGACTATAASDCPSAPFADPGPAAMGAAVAHVRADAPAACPAGAVRGGAECPWRTIAEGVASGRAWVLVGDGAYAERVDVTTALHLVGRCAARVEIRGAGGGATVLARGSAALDLSGVTVRGEGIGVQVTEDAAVRATGVRVAGAVRTGVRVVDRARFEGRDVVIADTRLEGTRGYGVSFDATGSCTLERAALVRNRSAGALAKRGTFTVRDSVIAGTLLVPVQGFAAGLFANEGATVLVERALIADNDDTGATIGDATTAVTMTDVIVRRTRSATGSTNDPVAVRVQNGARYTANRLQVVENAGHGVYVERGEVSPGALGEAPHATLRDSVIRGPTVSPPGTRQVGLFAQRGSIVEAYGLRVVAAVEEGVIATGAGTSVLLVDSEVSGTRVNSRPDAARLGCGVKVESGARLTGRRVLVADNRWSGVLIDEPPEPSDPSAPDLTLEDSVILGNHYDLARGTGAAVQVQRGAAALLQRVTFSGNEATGLIAMRATATVIDSVFEAPVGVPQPIDGGMTRTQARHIAAQEDATVTARGVVLRAGRGAVGAVAAGERAVVTLDGVLCEGPDQPAWTTVVPCLIAERGGQLSAEGTALRRALGTAAYVWNTSSTLTLIGSLVQGTRSAVDASGEAVMGRGLAAYVGGALHVTRVLVEDNPDVGILAADTGTRLALSRVVVRDIRALPSGLFGQGVFVQTGAAMVGDRVVVSGSTASGVFSTTGALVALSDSLITDIRPSGLGGLGGGVDVLPGSSLTAERVVIRRVYNAAVTAVMAGASATLRDVIVADVRANPSELAAGVLSVGRGLQALRGGSVAGDRVALIDTTGFAVVAAQESPVAPNDGPSRVVLTDLFVRNVRPTPTAAAPLDQRYGYGLLTRNASAIEVNGGLIDLGAWGFAMEGGAMTLRRLTTSRQSQGLGRSSLSRAATMLLREGGTESENLVDEVLFGQRESELNLASQHPRCTTASECERDRVELEAQSQSREGR